MSRPHTSAKYSPIALRPRITFGLLGWSLWSTTCNSASSAYRPSSVAASRSSMPRRSASASNDRLTSVVWLVLIVCLPWSVWDCNSDTTIACHRQSTVKSSRARVRDSGAAVRRSGHSAAKMTRAMLEIQVIGELEVRLAGAKAELPAGRRVRALLGWLAIHPGRHHRSRLAGQFWPDVLDASARASLRSAIWAL